MKTRSSILRRSFLDRLWRLVEPGRPLAMLLPVLEPVLRRFEIARWNEDWGVESRRPAGDLSAVVPEELVEAVESGWVPASSSVIDIGSGRGQVSAWLAERGFRVLGVDVSPRATALARKHFRHLGERLEFRTLDVCGAVPEFDRFDWLVDRGCFHVIPELLCGRYLANVATWAKPGAPFLLFSRASRATRVPELLAAHFDIIRSQPSPYVRSAGSLPRVTAPGMTFWMRRR
jgi:SAM-dependent methyltransferase